MVWEGTQGQNLRLNRLSHNKVRYELEKGFLRKKHSCLPIFLI